jgi:hypothetical protein
VTYHDVAGSRRDLLSPVLCDTGGGHLVYACPGCGHEHAVATSMSEPGDRWTMSGSASRPTFRPSVHYMVAGPTGKKTKCHHWVIDGEIQFLPDSRHALAGKTVAMVPPRAVQRYATPLYCSKLSTPARAAR